MIFPRQQGQQFPGIGDLVVRDAIAAVSEPVGTETGSDAGILSGKEVGMVIADHQRLLRLATKLIEGLLEWIGVRFFMGKRVTANDCAKKA